MSGQTEISSMELQLLPYLLRDLAKQDQPAYVNEKLNNAADEIDRLRNGIAALQDRCCGSDDLCNGCRALLAIIYPKEGEEFGKPGPNGRSRRKAGVGI